MEFLALLGKTLLLRPYVFLFLAVALATSTWLIGKRRTAIFFLLTWMTAFVCEFSSTRTGVPFGWYFYNGSTVGRELYISNVPFMDSLSFSFLLFTSHCLALTFLLPARGRGRTMAMRADRTTRTSAPALGLTVLFFVLLDVVIDPVALRGDRWFLGKIYYYPEPGLHFGVPIANYLGWAVVGLVAFGLYQRLDRWLSKHEQAEVGVGGAPLAGPPPTINVAPRLLVGCALYYGILGFNLAVTFWIGEPLIGATGILMYLPITALLLLKLAGRLPMPAPSQ
ncbi:MAG: carotenoid biosynthesis protein [Nitrospirae bacterium]|nr:MAG: carotenoid biosynthesis protein [Nitrospirota bacterium]